MKKAKMYKHLLNILIYEFIFNNIFKNFSIGQNNLFINILSKH